MSIGGSQPMVYWQAGAHSTTDARWCQTCSDGTLHIRAAHVKVSDFPAINVLACENWFGNSSAPHGDGDIYNAMFVDGHVASVQDSSWTRMPNILEPFELAINLTEKLDNH